MESELDKTVAVRYLEKIPSGTKVYSDRQLGAELIYTPKGDSRRTPRNYINRKCIYFLVNKTYRPAQTNQLYIRQKDAIVGRLNNHKLSKPFWDLALCGFGRSSLEYEIDLRYLETETYKEIADKGGYNLVNDQKPEPHELTFAFLKEP